MKVGVFTALLSQLPLDEVLKKLKAFQIDTVELGTGNYPGDAHCKLSMLENSSALAEFKSKLADHGASISALSCHGNSLHPNADRARQAREISRKTILLAEKLGVPVVVDFSGCPGDSLQSTTPNWVTCPWPPDYRNVLEWQWNEVVAPYWIEHAAFASQHGIKIAVEMHPGFVVYSPETMLRLRSLTGPAVGCNYDPSHMFWQGNCSHQDSCRGDLPRSCQRHTALRNQSAPDGGARHQALHRRAEPWMDLPHLRLRSWRGVVEGVRFHAQNVRLR